ncbi:AAA family ATPase, partial [Carboxylicivirga marina]
KISLKGSAILSSQKLKKLIFRTHLKVGLDGRNAYNILINDTLAMDESLIDKISEWYCNNFDGWGLRINEDKDPYLEIELTRDDKLAVNLRDVGEGMGQTLPLVTRALMPIEDEILIAMEQPELHLHPGAHGNLAQLFAENFIQNKKHFLIETHSQNFILRMRRLVAQKKLNPDDILIYYVDFDEDLGESNLVPIEIKSNGDVTNWPEDIFNEALEETIEILNAKKV